MTANELVENAKELLGVKYVWGGNTPQSGLDCSGLLYYIQKKAGSEVGDMTASGYSKLGKKIPIGEQKVGDFLFFGYPVTHCAIFIGNGYMIESRGGRKNTADNPGIGVVKSLVSRRSDLSCIRRVWDEKSPSYEIGRTYTTMVEHLHVRYSVWGQIKKYAQLTRDGMKHAYSDGCLKKGTTVTVKEIKKDETGATWVRIPSGWICAITSKGDIYLS
jgi:cell wall-associated NlpC family hydrolase|uniref:Cell wall-associated hydrolase n=1 Tax=Podoviridae sp. ctDd04 TaxID=2825232 RepID=A0A8S5U758_9CAUD|nr:MAG TPA: cell wall-associated hydrolase [Podoviridae sp. ctDd04]